MYLQHFGLTDRPFRIVPSPRFFFVSETHDEGRARILYGIRENRFGGEMRKHNTADKNPFITREQNKCIMCGLCVRVCEEVQGVGAIGYAERGFESKVTVPFGHDLDCEFCGQHYRFDAVDIEQIFASTVIKQSPATKH